MSIHFEDVVAQVPPSSPGARSAPAEPPAAPPALPPDRDPARLRRARADAIQLVRREARLRAT